MKNYRLWLYIVIITVLFTSIMASWWLLVSYLWALTSASSSPRPNIVFIMADDVGWNDVGFHGSEQILTPNLDALAYGGVALQRYYTNCVCTPSRAALLTAKYAHRTGMQGFPITNSEDRGIPLTEKLLPQYLKELGYATHLVGKWHVGASRTAYLPTERGFDSHFGFRSGTLDYYEYLGDETWTTGRVAGLDLYRNLSAAWDVEGYLTDVLTREAVEVISRHDAATPLYLHLAHAAPHCGPDAALLQAPPEAVRAQRHVLLPERRLLAGMMSKLDDSVGEVVKALSEKNILNNTIIVFVTDNGGMTEGPSENWASNWPLRGQKMSPFEGGVRVVGLVWGSMMTNPGHVWSGMMHVTDWLPTLLSAVEGDIPENIDGVDQWQSILDLGESKRNKIIVDINDFSGFASIISGDFKLLSGTLIERDGSYLGGDLLEVIGTPPPYLDILRSGAVFEALAKIGKPVDLNKIQDTRTDMKINCTKLDEEMCNINAGKSCLYNIILDPCEQHDLSSTMPELAHELITQLMEEWVKRVPRILHFRDPASDPRLHNNTWKPWLD